MEVYINNAEDLNGTTRQLVNPFRININKTQVIVNYPATYQQDFNFHPVEQVIPSNVFSCQDGDKAQSPTCGWMLDTTGSYIPYSQGFCCSCNFGQITGIDNSQTIRGLPCSSLNMGTGSANAHCLRYDQLWYSAYNVKNWIIDYKINIILTYSKNGNPYVNSTDIINNTASMSSTSKSSSNITSNYGNFSVPSNNNKSVVNSSDFSTEIIKLSPSNLIDFSARGNMKAQIIGDFMPPTLPPDFSSFYLTIPTYPPTNTMVLQGPLSWMLIPKNFFTLDGSECNKIGVSYYAFKLQNNPCSGQVGNCLKSQIFDLYNEDISRMQKGSSPKYLIQQRGDYQFSFYSPSQDKKEFSFEVKGVYNTLLTLEISADDIKFVINVSPGSIDYLFISNFEATTNNGLMKLLVTNTGALQADYYISFECSPYIIPVPGSTLSLNSMQSQSIMKEIFTVNDKFQVNDCTVVLKNSQGVVTDSKSARFNTTEVVKFNNQNFNYTPNQTTNNSNATSSSVSITPKELTCEDYCPSFWNLFCFLSNSCWMYILRLIGVVLIILLCFVVIYKLIQNKCCCKCIEKIMDFIIPDFKQEQKVIANKNMDSNNNLYPNNNCICKSMYMNFSLDRLNSEIIDLRREGFFQDFSVETLAKFSLEDSSLIEINIIGGFNLICIKYPTSMQEFYRIIKIDSKFFTEYPQYPLYR